MKDFEQINKGYNSVFRPDGLSVGLVVPIERYATGPVPTMKDHLQRVQLAEQLGFKAVWIRDVPFNVPSFGDAGQTYDPFTYLGFLAGQTNKIALGVASIALPLHHPVHVSKAAASVDQLSDGRLILGVASGDRPDEYPAMGINFEKRGELFRESFSYIRKAQESFPEWVTEHYGNLKGDIDILPKASIHKIPLLITGGSRQSLEWNAEHGDGWMSYPRDLYNQYNAIRQWRELVTEYGEHNKPFMQPLYVILDKDDDLKPHPIQLGFKIGANYLVNYLQKAQDIGVNHVALNLRFNSREIQETMEHLAEKVLPHFHTNKELKVRT